MQKSFLSARELKHTHKLVSFFAWGSNFGFDSILAESTLSHCNSHPGRDFSGAPLMPFAPFLSLLLHEEHLTASHCTHSWGHSHVPLPRVSSVPCSQPQGRVAVTITSLSASVVSCNCTGSTLHSGQSWVEQCLVEVVLLEGKGGYCT